MRPTATAFLAAASLLGTACSPPPAGPSASQDRPFRSGTVLTERLSDAAFQGNRKAVEDMLPTVDVNATDEGGRTMLMLASYGGHSTTVRLLCENKADPNRRDANRRTALMYAASGPNARSVEILLAHGAQVNVTDGEEGWTALMFASAEGHADIVGMLLDRGADPGLMDIDGESALTFALNNGHNEVAAMLRGAQRR